jgi:hypothetical protein
MMDNIYIRELKDPLMLIAILVEQKHNNYLEYSNITTETYKTITTWCNICTDLKPFKNTTLKQTYNGILFDPESKSFMDLKDDIWDYEITLENIYPKELTKHMEIKLNNSFLKEIAFPQNLLNILEMNEAIGKRISVNSQYIDNSQ